MKHPVIPLIGRIFIAIAFLTAFIGKLTNFAGTQGFMESMGMPAAALLLVLALIIEIVGVLSLILGYKVKWGAIILIVFLVITTLIFHLDFSDQNQMTHFMKNIAILGGLLYVIYTGPGRYSLDKK